MNVQILASIYCTYIYTLLLNELFVLLCFLFFALLIAFSTSLIEAVKGQLFQFCNIKSLPMMSTPFFKRDEKCWSDQCI